MPTLPATCNGVLNFLALTRPRSLSTIDPLAVGRREDQVIRLVQEINHVLGRTLAWSWVS